MTQKASNDNSLVLPIIVALANIGLFGALFTAMWYFELLGADPDYFDAGTVQNLQYINLVTSKLGIVIDPLADPRVTTLGWALCLGIALISTWFTIVLANRKSLDEVETTDPVGGA